MANDPTKRVLNDRKTKDFIVSCCMVPIVWSDDFTNWNTTNEVWDITYFKNTPIYIYIGPE